jgi:pimeloyl-ACP methyl ester carboxylesterase
VNTYGVSPAGKLVRTRTPDGLELEGFLVRPESTVSEDVVYVHIHGMFENYHMPLFIDPIAGALSAAGATFLTVNTRAQDYYLYFRRWTSATTFEWQLWGGSREIFAHCLLDLEGWMEFCRRELSCRVVLMGHSHGALKASYYAAEQADNDQLAALALLSPSDDIGLQKRHLTTKYDGALALARRKVESGREDELMPGWVYDQPVTAGMYTDMFGSDSQLAMFTFTDPMGANGLAAEIGLPTLVVFASDDVATAGVSSDVALQLSRRALKRVENFTGRVIDGANHQYLGREDVLALTIAEWHEAIRVTRP